MIEDVKYPHFYENWIGETAGAGIAHALCGRYSNSEQSIIYDVSVEQSGPLGNAMMTANVPPRPRAVAETNRAPDAARSGWVVRPRAVGTDNIVALDRAP